MDVLHCVGRWHEPQLGVIQQRHVLVAQRDEVAPVLHVADLLADEVGDATVAVPFGEHLLLVLPQLVPFTGPAEVQVVDLDGHGHAAPAQQLHAVGQGGEIVLLEEVICGQGGQRELQIGPVAQQQGGIDGDVQRAGCGLVGQIVTSVVERDAVGLLVEVVAQRGGDAQLPVFVDQLFRSHG